MEPLHQQLGLDLTRGSEMAVLETIDKIARELHDYSDNGPVRIEFKKTAKVICKWWSAQKNARRAC